MPQIEISGMASFGTQSSFPQRNIDDNFNLSNVWNIVRGRNNIHVGGDVWWIRANGFQNFAYGPTGGFAFGPGATASPTGPGLGPFGLFANSFAAFLLGTASDAGRNLPNLTPAYNTTQGAIYLSDVLKLSDRLTLNLGARWEVFSPLSSRYSGGVFIYNPATNNLLPINTNGVDNVGNVQTNWKNIGPRVGFAYPVMAGTVGAGGYSHTFFNS